MKFKDINVLIFRDDYIIDRLDDNNMRRVESFKVHSSEIVSVCMTDGGYMDLAEITLTDVRLESEVVR